MLLRIMNLDEISIEVSIYWEEAKHWASPVFRNLGDKREPEEETGEEEPGM